MAQASARGFGPELRKVRGHVTSTQASTPGEERTNCFSKSCGLSR